MLISRTGYNEGAVYNALGTNLTEYPDGAKNQTVGSFFLDFSALTGLSIYYTNELTFVLADGTKRFPDDDQDGDTSLTGTGDQQFDGFDDDEVELDMEDDSSVVTAERGTVTRVSFDLLLGMPEHSDALVWTALAEDTNYTNAVINELNSGLVTWLDTQYAHFSEAGDNFDAWWQYWQFLRWSLHWMVYKVRVSTNNPEGQQDDIAQSGLSGALYPGGVLDDGYTEFSYPEFGSVGLLSATGHPGAANATANAEEYPELPWVRLWEEDVPQYVRRGDLILPYAQASTVTTVLSSPATPIDVDVDIDGVDTDAFGYEEPNAGSERGRNLRLRRSFRCNVPVGPDEILILHVQSGRARLQAPDFDDNTPGLIIGGDSSPVMGPKFTLHRHEVRVRASRRRSKRR